MCIKTPEPPEVPPAPAVPSKASEEAQARRANVTRLALDQQGRQETVRTSAQGADDFGENLRRTKLGGL